MSDFILIRMAWVSGSPKSGIELEHPRPRSRHHEAGVEHTLEEAPLGCHAVERAPDDLRHDVSMLRLREARPGRNGSHAARIRALIVVEGPFVVLGQNHGKGSLAVAEDQERNLLAREELLHHHS